ncbi:MAG: MBL fold metallo-hydrolase [Patescibacteria group bacterium]|jgi:L-ascorbate metabolism protein UlaG (beta-lactamase superfamily)|nr:MBL fold metallo-hydrolase [Patescibacteria group bacterium]
MNITWYGQSCFLITIQKKRTSKKKVSILIDPFDEKTGLKIPKIEADVVLVTHDHFDHNNTKIVKGEPFIIDSPGEYELHNVFIQGTQSYHDQEEGAKRGLNTIYTLEIDGVRLCHLGDFGEKEISLEQMKEIGEVDVLMIPVGGVYTIDAKEATRVVSQLEPRIVIPMHYKVEGLDVDIDDLSLFLKAIGEKEVKTEEELVVEENNLPSLEMKVIPLNIKNNEK